MDPTPPHSHPGRTGIRWHVAGLPAAALALVLAAAPPASAAVVPEPGAPLARADVIVLESSIAGEAPAAAVRRAGGTVTRRLPLVDGFSASVPRARLGDVRSARGVRGVVPDRRLQMLSDPEAVGTTGASLAHVRAAIGLAGDADAGAGVDVALVDSGVSPVPALAGQVVDGPDLSGDADDASKRHLDGFGHGTHLAGIIAGAAAGEGGPGVAPGARVVNVKVADRDGATSLSRILAGIDWVVRHRRDDGLDIRVLNLSFGAEPGAGDRRHDPLAFAVERAWRAGITVVVAGGNGGADSAGLDSPADDPYVVAVGAAATEGTDPTDDDTVADFSSSGSAIRSPDVVAPGVGILSARVPGSLLEEAFPAARIGETQFRGSGTSQAAAVVSAAAAALIADRPVAGPDEVKAALRAGARPLGTPEIREGRGMIDVPAAAVAMPRAAAQHHPPARGAGPWRSQALIPQLATEHPNATRWSATRWSATRWSATRWSATRWSATRWSATRWSATRWSATRWSTLGE